MPILSESHKLLDTKRTLKPMAFHSTAKALDTMPLRQIKPTVFTLSEWQPPYNLAITTVVPFFYVTSMGTLSLDTELSTVLV
jgi:hypothetical protein